MEAGGLLWPSAAAGGSAQLGWTGAAGARAVAAALRAEPWPQARARPGSPPARPPMPALHPRLHSRAPRGQVAAEAAADIQRLQTEVLTENNVKALRESVQTLTKTLQHIERITGARLERRGRRRGMGWRARARARQQQQQQQQAARALLAAAGVLHRRRRGAAAELRALPCRRAAASPPLNCPASQPTNPLSLTLSCCRRPGRHDERQTGDRQPQAAHRGAVPHRGGLMWLVADGAVEQWPPGPQPASA